ncbi:MAG: hypothetical protein AB2L11_06530 [Syntrophobacteraceae bacterium]
MVWPGKHGILRVCRFGIVIVICLMGSSLVGCGSVQRNQRDPMLGDKSNKVDAESKAWLEGIEDFKNGDYAKAMAVFEFLSENAENNEVYRKAVYALACTRLILAQTPEEFNEALTLWDCWNRQVPDSIRDEDPRMMAPFLERITPPGSPEFCIQGQARSKKKAPAKIDFLNKDVLVYKNLLEAKEKEFERTKVKLDLKEKEVRRLRQQIDSLEAIHLKFQEKQKEVSSP